METVLEHSATVMKRFQCDAPLPPSEEPRAEIMINNVHANVHLNSLCVVAWL